MKEITYGTERTVSVEEEKYVCIKNTSLSSSPLPTSVTSDEKGEKQFKNEQKNFNIATIVKDINYF